MADKDMLEFVNRSKNIIDADVDDEKETNNETPDSMSSEMRNIIKTTRGILATDHVILNHGQVTWTTPELAPPLLTTTPHQREDVSALDRFNVHRCPTRRVFSGTGIELTTCLPCSYDNPTPLAHADTSRDVLPRGGTSQGILFDDALKHVTETVHQATIDGFDSETLTCVFQELDYQLDVSHGTKVHSQNTSVTVSNKTK
ncbi:uncharacterized protein TNCV_2169781 [Trichonephila clavipes]|nr:uncharacterized protein TNCV_2169781 [Trichonephila clavipes]